jgi:hypothetical protein
MKHSMLSTDFLNGLNDESDTELIEDSIRDWFKKWAGEIDDEDSMTWHEFLELQTQDYQERALALAELAYGAKRFAPERQLDFMIGYTFASYLIWTAAKKGNDTPVA